MKVGIIGGSGLDDPNILEGAIDKVVMTPFGEPSSSLKIGNLNGVDVVLLARHGKDHSIMPTNVNFRANIWALKEEGCTHLLVSTACGSLREHIKPGDFVFIDQFIDRTTKRSQSFYNDPCYPAFADTVCHIPMADPFCLHLRTALAESARELGLGFHDRGTMVTIEGPRFSSRSESHFFRQIGGDVINMSTVPEVVLAREAGMCYAAIAMATDYDCWHISEESVSWDMILEVFKKNVANVLSLFRQTLPKIVDVPCSCREAIKTSVVGSGSTEENVREKVVADNDMVGDPLIKIKQSIRTVPHFPKEGIMFRDITTLLKDKHMFALTVDHLVERYKNSNLHYIVGIESRGFILGSVLAYKLGLGFIPVRKPGKLPAATDSVEYTLEYGVDTLEIHLDALQPGERVLIVDDLIATGGTLLAAIQLVEKRGAQIHECAAVIDLPALNWREKFNGYNIYSMISFDGH